MPILVKSDNRTVASRDVCSVCAVQCLDISWQSERELFNLSASAADQSGPGIERRGSCSGRLSTCMAFERRDASGLANSFGLGSGVVENWKSVLRLLRPNAFGRRNGTEMLLAAELEFAARRATRRSARFSLGSGRKLARFLVSQKLQNDFTLGRGRLGIGKALPEQGQVFAMDIPVHVVIPPWLNQESKFATKGRKATANIWRQPHFARFLVRQPKMKVRRSRALMRRSYQVLFSGAMVRR